MQEKIPLTLLALFLLFGVFLLRGGVTGNVISESCCFGPDCAPENVCTSAGPNLEQPAILMPEDNSALSAVGLLIVVTSASLVFAHLKRRINRQKQEMESGTRTYLNHSA